MLTEVDISLLLGAILVCLLATHWRERLWIGLAALSYINATIAWRMGIPYAEAITAMGDAAVCLAVYFAGRYKWEMWIWRLFQTSVAISMLYLAGNLGVFLSIPHEIYSILMEAVNWLLLLLIGSLSVAQRIGAANVGAFRSWGSLRYFALALRRQRKADPFPYLK